MKKASFEENIEKKLGIAFQNPRLLHTALVHRSYLNESPEPESNERLEFLGDAVLELIVSATLFNNYPNLQEGELTALRSKLVNKNALAEVARNLSLGEALYLSAGEESGGGRQNESLLADTFEAIIGALFLDQGTKACEKIIKQLILTHLEADLSRLKDPKSLLQELIQAQGRRTPTYKALQEAGPDHAKTFTVGVFVGGEKLAQGVGKTKQEAEQEAAQKALVKL